MIYDAFISYRHTPLDMEFAKKVHTGLETFRVPAAVRKKTGKKKISRVFRDQEELPIGSDLNDNISAALKESEYLIVICSPETPGSYWVNKEIETFIELHDREHILAVLTDGEPDQSFPEALLSDGNGNPVEPLAADVRGKTPSERNKRFKSELLRLAAPVLGCTYDDLRQRHRERILKRNLMIGAAAAAIFAGAGTAFGIYNAGVAKRMTKLADEKAVLADEKTQLADEKTQLADEMTKLADEKTKLADEILAEYREKQKNQSRFYAEEALVQLRVGNREDAVLIASAGLPSAENDRPFVADAEYALASSLRAYDTGSNLSYERLLVHDLTIGNMLTDRSLKYLTTVDTGYNVYVWDCETWGLLRRIYPVLREDGFKAPVLSAFADRNGIYVAYQKSIVRFDYDGKETGRINPGINVSTCKWYDVHDTLVCIAYDRILLISLSDFSIRKEIMNAAGDRYGSDCVISSDGRYMVVEHFAPGGGAHPHVSIIDLTDYSVVTTEVSEESILNLAITAGGNVAVVSTNEDFFYADMTALTLDVLDIHDGHKLFSTPVPIMVQSIMTFNLLLDAHAYQDQGVIVVVLEADAYSFDEKTGKQLTHITLAGAGETLDLVGESTTAFIGLRNGDVVAVNTHDGRIYTESTESTGESLEDMVILDGGVVLQRPLSNTLAVMTLHPAEDLKKLPDLPAEPIGVAVAPSSAYYVLADRYNQGAMRFYDSEGTLLYSVEMDRGAVKTGFIGDTFLAVRYTSYERINPFEKETKRVTFAETGACEGYSNAVISPDSRYLTLWGTYGIAVIDLSTDQCILMNREYTSTGAAALSGDGSTLLISESGSTLMLLDMESGEIRSAEDEALYQIPNNSSLRYISCDATGKYAAMACADGNVRVITLPEAKTLFTLPMPVRSVCFLGFTNDSKHIIVQGDDYFIRFYNVATGRCVNGYSAPAPLAYMVEDDGRIALCDNYTVSLVDAEEFGRLAYVEDGITYLAAKKLFILSVKKNVWTTGYKDYKALLEEAKRQFPGAVLSEEKRVMYNIEE